MNPRERVQKLLDEIFDSNVTPEEVCSDCPELLSEVREQWQQMCAVEADLDALFPAQDPSTCVDTPGSREVSADLPHVPGYAVEAVLGQGGMGIVYKAKHLALKRTVALKMIAGSHVYQADRAGFVAEAEAVARLQHPNIVQIHEIGEAEGRPFFALEFIDGGSLARRLAGRPLLPRDAANVVKVLAEAVHFAHARSLVHRDLKPANVLLSGGPDTPIAQCQPKVADFGLALQLGEELHHTQVGRVVGTPSYMAPEQAEGHGHAVGPSADVYGLGAILYECLTGRAPFCGSTKRETLEQVRTMEPAAPSLLNRQAPRDLETICLKCLRKQQEQRYPSARDLADDLGRFLRGEPVTARPVGVVERVLKWVRRRPTAAGLLAAVVLLVVSGIAGTGVLFRQRVTALARQNQTDHDVGAVLQRARGLLEQGWHAADLTQITEACAEANRAGDIARSGTASEAVQEEAEAFRELALVRLKRGKKNHELLEALLDVSIPQENRAYVGARTNTLMVLAEPSVDEQYVSAFRRWGADVIGATEAEVVARLEAEPDAVVQEFTAALDNWMLERRRKHFESEWRRLFRLADQLDRSDRGRRLRRLLVGGPQPRPEELAVLAGVGSPWLALWELSRGSNLRELRGMRREMDPRTEPVLTLVLLAQALAEWGDARNAEEVLRRAVIAHPDQVIMLSYLGKLLESQGTSRLAEAIGYYRTAHTKRPQLGIVLSIALFNAGMRSESEEVMQALIQMKPDNPAFHFYHGIFELWQRKYGDAARDFRKTIELKPDDGGAYFCLATVFAETERFNDAEAAYRKAIELKPYFGEAYSNLGNLLDRQGKLDEAMTAFTKAIEINPNLSHAHSGIGNALFKQQKLGQAEAAFRRVIELEPGDALPYANLARLLSDQQRHAEAEAVYRKVIALSPNFAEIRHDFGNSLLAQNKLAEAEAAYREAIALKFCDASVVNRGTAPHELARVLLEFAKQQQAEPFPGNWGLASSFLRQATVKERIHHLLEENYMRRTTPLPRRWKFTLAIAMLALLTGLGGFGWRSEAAQNKTAGTVADKQPAGDNRVSTVQEPKDGVLQPPAHGIVVDESGHPIADATVLLHRVMGKAKPALTETDADGKFLFTALPGEKKNGFALRVVAVHAGFAPAEGTPFNEKLVKLVLNKPATVTGTLKDRLGKPIANAHVQMGMVENHGTMRSWGYADREVLQGTTLEPFFLASTDADGKFRFTTAPVGKELIFRTEAQGFADFDTSGDGSRRGYVATPDSAPVALLLEEEARIDGQVISSVPGVGVAGLFVYALASSNSQTRKQTKTDATGHFAFVGMPTDAFDLWLEQPENQPCTSRVLTLIGLSVGNTTPVKLELIPGVLVEGRAAVAGTNAPVVGASVEVRSRDLPVFAAVLRQVKTDEQGRYSLHLSPGNVTIFARNWPGDIQPSREGGRPTLLIPEGVARIAGPTLIFEPKTALPRQVPLEGRVVDAQGEPVAGATIVGMCRADNCVALGGDKVVTDASGHFRLAHGPQGGFSPGEATALQVETPGGKVFEAHIVAKEGQVEVRLPTLVAATTPAIPQTKVLPDELSGLVLDENRRPIEGVHVHIWDWVDRPENQTLTNKNGRFRLSEKGDRSKVQVRFRKHGYSPVMIVQQPLGVVDLVVVMDQKTYFQGVVYGPDGKPAANALLRANQGPKRGDGVLITEVWTEAKADASGRYRMYVEPDSYEFVVKAPGVGTARLPKRAISHGETPTLDIKLQVPVIFRHQVADSVTGKPVQGLRLYNWFQKDVDGRSDASGTLLIDDMLPGIMQFQVESDRYTRWWSADAAKEHQQFQGPEFGSRFQRNFDPIDFDVQLGKAPVHIIVEKGVQITGRVVDPDGEPVAGATVAPARTGTGNSLTGDTRFSVLSGADGKFTMLLPASGKAEYNLVVHDGKYQEWRHWANGVLPPIQTSPGQHIKDVAIALTRPATVRGKVVDAQGKPIAGREVRASAADKMENRYYDPTTKTKDDGTFELRFVRAGEQHIQVAPFWLSAEQAPAGSSKPVNLNEGETVESVNLTAGEARR